MENLNAEIIAIGTELLLGEITDTNSVFLAQTFRDIGINVFYMTTVGDNQQRISQVIKNALDRSDIVITCGGLGPTVDDMTRQSVANATERDLVFHQELLDAILQRFSSFRVTMTENNRPSISTRKCNRCRKSCRNCAFFYSRISRKDSH